MDNTSLCTCTDAYYCPDENQWEPPHECSYCAHLRHEYNSMQEEQLEDTYRPVTMVISSLAGETLQVEHIEIDDLPF